MGSRPSMPSIPRPSMPSMPSLPWTGGSGSSGSEKDRSDRSDVSDLENASSSNNKSKSKRYKSMMSKMKNPLRKKRKQMMQQQDEDAIEPTHHGVGADAVNESDTVTVDPQVLNAIPARLHKTLQDLDVFSDDEADEEESAIMSKNRNNPWFTPEIASIVKLCRKYRRKHHKSKTKKSELKEICRELEKRKRKLIRSAKQKWNGSQRTNDVETNAAPESGDQNLKVVESRENVMVQRVDGEGIIEVDVGVDGAKIAPFEEVITDLPFDDGSIALVVPGIDPPTPPLLTPDPPDPSIVSVNDDLYDPVYEIYLMLMREGNAGSNAADTFSHSMDVTRDDVHHRM